MRHRVKGRKLGRTASHRVATLRSLATALFTHKKIKTTVAKAKTARTFIEPLITRAKTDDFNSRRYVARHIKDKAVLQELFNTIVPKIGDRKGGYTRVIKLGQRPGDGAEMAVLELVDFAEVSEVTTPKSKEVEETKVEDAKVVEETATVNEPVEEPEVTEEEPKAEETTEEEKESSDEDKSDEKGEK